MCFIFSSSNMPTEEEISQATYNIHGAGSRRAGIPITLSQPTAEIGPHVDPQGQSSFTYVHVLLYIVLNIHAVCFRESSTPIFHI